MGAARSARGTASSEFGGGGGLQDPLLPQSAASAEPAAVVQQAVAAAEDHSLSAETNTVVKEALELLYLTGAIFVSRVSWVIIKTTDSALLGEEASP